MRHREKQFSRIHDLHHPTDRYDSVHIPTSTNMLSVFTRVRRPTNLPSFLALTTRGISTGSKVPTLPLKEVSVQLWCYHYLHGQCLHQVSRELALQGKQPARNLPKFPSISTTADVLTDKASQTRFLTGERRYCF